MHPHLKRGAWLQVPRSLLVLTDASFPHEVTLDVGQALTPRTGILIIKEKQREI